MRNKIERTSLQLQIIQWIKLYIEEHQLRAGDKLPSQDVLLRLMGVSRTALREAMKTLEAHQVVVIKNGKGVYVAGEEDKVFLDLIDFTKEKEHLLEALEVRKVLEREMLQMVIYRATDEELERLGTITKELMDKFHRGERQTEVDRLFHFTIYQLSHNEVMQQMILAIQGVLQKFWQFPLDMEDPFLESIPLHESLYLAICEKNVKKAQMINEQLLNVVYRDIERQQ